MIGYHYTSYENWKGIKRDGMIIPYPVEDLKNTIIGMRNGIWLWKNKPKGKNHVGLIIDRVAKKNTTKVVVLECEFDSNDILRNGNKLIEMRHRGDIGNFVYHKRFPSYIITKPIVRFKLLKIYDVIQRLT